MSDPDSALDLYGQQFKQLRKDKNRNRYPEATKHAAPHKPLLLRGRAKGEVWEEAIASRVIIPDVNYN